jgi:single-stranded-DNA-specific exonuclease
MIWQFSPPTDFEMTHKLMTDLGVEEAIATLLIQRGVRTFEEAKTFFRPSLEQLHDPMLMADMSKAINRIKLALDKDEFMMVFGDYDVDGTTAVSLMASYLRSRTDKVTTYIPDRYSEGYGLSLQGIDLAANNDISLMIVLDCGIKAVDKVAYAKNLGIDIIICDHHTPGETIPDAVAVLDPKRSDCNYPFKDLCGCGVGFKLIQGIEQSEGHALESLKTYLDLVAVSIGADMVSMTDENRVMTYFGLQQINTEPRPGLKALMSPFDLEEFSNSDVVFKIAPRINAAGRMEHGNFAVALLMAPNEIQAQELAEKIESYNTDRRVLDQGITDEALTQIQTNREIDRFSTVVYNPNWLKGVIGIVASRLTETHYRPTVVFTKSGDHLVASARSVKGFDLYSTLEACSDTMVQFGGHKYAAGLTIREDQYHNFKTKFEEEVASRITKTQRIPTLTVDLELDFSEITPKFYRILEQFAPFGPDNMTPVFMSKSVVDSGFGKRVGTNGDHLKLNLQQSGHLFSAIGFGLGDQLERVKNNTPFDVAYTIEINEWNGNKSLQLKLKDLK